VATASSTVEKIRFLPMRSSNPLRDRFCDIRGRIWFRWFLPEATPTRPLTRLVPVSEVARGWWWHDGESTC
jgi:hypothetical protein